MAAAVSVHCVIADIPSQSLILYASNRVHCPVRSSVARARWRVVSLTAGHHRPISARQRRFVQPPTGTKSRPERPAVVQMFFEPSASLCVLYCSRHASLTVRSDGARVRSAGVCGRIRGQRLMTAYCAHMLSAATDHLATRRYNDRNILNVMTN